MQMHLGHVVHMLVRHFPDVFGELSVGCFLHMPSDTQTHACTHWFACTAPPFKTRPDKPPVNSFSDNDES